MTDNYDFSDRTEPSIPLIFRSDADERPVSAAVVLNGYRNLAKAINKANEGIPVGERFCIPFGVQEAIRRYVDEREAIESIESIT